MTFVAARLYEVEATGNVSADLMAGALRDVRRVAAELAAGADLLDVLRWVRDELERIGRRGEMVDPQLQLCRDKLSGAIRTIDNKAD